MATQKQLDWIKELCDKKKVPFPSNINADSKHNEIQAALNELGIDTSKPKEETPKAETNEYAKDPVGLAIKVFISLDKDGNAVSDIREYMKLATDLVKQAQEAF